MCETAAIIAGFKAFLSNKITQEVKHRNVSLGDAHDAAFRFDDDYFCNRRDAAHYHERSCLYA